MLSRGLWGAEGVGRSSGVRTESPFGGGRVLAAGDGGGCATVWVSSALHNWALQDGSDGKLCVR